MLKILHGITWCRQKL